MPVTTLAYLEHTGYKDKYGWLSFSSIGPDSATDILLIEMSTAMLPDQDRAMYKGKSFLFALSIPSGMEQVSLKGMRRNIHAIANYKSEGEFTEPDPVTGTVEIKKMFAGTVNLTAEIKMGSSENTQYTIDIEDVSIPLSSYKDFKELEKERIKAQARIEEAVLSYLQKISAVEKEFYDSVFNLTLYPDNKLKASLEGEKLFNFIPDKSYAVAAASIAPLASENLLDLLSGIIYHPASGKNTILILHSLFMGDTAVDGDECNYSLAIELPSTAPGEYRLDRERPGNAKLGYWLYGPDAYLVESQSYEGSIKITSSDKDKIQGYIYLSFWSAEKRRFNIHGDFELPVLEKADFIPLMRKISVLMQEEKAGK